MDQTRVPDYCEPGLIRSILLKELQKPAPRSLLNIEAELLIVAGQYILHYRDKHGQPQTKFLSAHNVRQAFVEEPVDSQWLPERTVRWGLGRKGPWLVQWIPPGKHTIVLQGPSMPQEPITIPLPGLLFGGTGKEYYVWAVKEQQFRPSLLLFHAPLSNLHPDGKVCFGTNHPPEASAKTFADAWQMFITSPFNGDLAGRKSGRHPEDIRQQLCAVQKKGTYPTSDLQPVKIYSGEQWTVEKAIERYFQKSQNF